MNKTKAILATTGIGLGLAVLLSTQIKPKEKTPEELPTTACHKELTHTENGINVTTIAMLSSTDQRYVEVAEIHRKPRLRGISTITGYDFDGEPGFESISKNMSGYFTDENHPFYKYDGEKFEELYDLVTANGETIEGCIE